MKKTKRDLPAPTYDVVKEGDMYRVRRNERMLTTPQGTPYDVPHKALAEAMLEEWRAQGDKIEPATMPLTQLTATVLDVTPATREKIIDGLLNYTRSELLCHRAERPEKLIARQDAEWQPLLDWCAEKFNLRFCPTSSVMPAPASDDMVENLRGVLESYDDYWLTGLNQAADVAGSLVLGLALKEQHITAKQAFDASELDIMHQQITWGEDPVTEGRQKAVLFDLEAVERWFKLI